MRTRLTKLESSAAAAYPVQGCPRCVPSVIGTNALGIRKNKMRPGTGCGSANAEAGKMPEPPPGHATRCVGLPARTAKISGGWLDGGPPIRGTPGCDQYVRSVIYIRSLPLVGTGGSSKTLVAGTLLGTGVLAAWKNSVYLRLLASTGAPGSKGLTFCGSGRTF